MTPEAVDEEYSKKIESKEDLALKQLIQRGVIKHFCGTGHENGSKVMEWIQDNSEKFRNIYNKKWMEEEGFLERARNNPEQIVNEIVIEMSFLLNT